MIITIDGPSGTGKSSVAREVAKKLGFDFFDTGAMYRLAAYSILKQKIPIEKEEKVARALKEFSLDIREQGGKKKYFLEEEDCTELIRLPEVTVASSKIATYVSVREKMVQIQREFGKRKSIVFEGRDMGTVVFPKAEVKFFLSASLSVRAQRRLEELIEKFPEEVFEKETIFREMERRDKADSNRVHSPLKKAKDALWIDTTDLSLKDVVEQVIQEVKQKKKPLKKKKFFYAFILLLAKIYFKIFYRYKVYGKERFPSGAAILACNHLSFLDPPLVAISSPEEIHFLAKQSLFRGFFLGKLIRLLNAHPIKDRSSNAKVFQLVIDLLRQGEKVLLFPEGARSWKGNLQELQSGVGLLAFRTQATIVPVYVKGTYEVWKRGQKLPKFLGKVFCVFGTPLVWNFSEKEEKKQQIESCMLQLEKSLRKLEKWGKGDKKTPPP